MYLKFYLCLHIVTIITIFVLPKFIRGERRSTNNAEAIDDSNTSVNVRSNNEASSEHNKLLNGNGTEEQEAIAIKQQQHIPHDSNNATSDLIKEHPAQVKKPINTPLTTCARAAVSVEHEQCEMDQLSNKLKEKIEAETKNIEDFIDKTVTETVGSIVEFKNDLMRDCEFPSMLTQEGLRKRTSLASAIMGGVSSAGGNTTDKPMDGGSIEESGAFLKKEIEVINAVVQQANVLPAVLSSGHAK